MSVSLSVECKKGSWTRARSRLALGQVSLEINMARTIDCHAKLLRHPNPKPKPLSNSFRPAELNGHYLTPNLCCWLESLPDELHVLNAVHHLPVQSGGRTQRVTRDSLEPLYFVPNSLSRNPWKRSCVRPSELPAPFQVWNRIEALRTQF